MASKHHKDILLAIECESDGEGKTTMTIMHNRELWEDLLDGFGESGGKLKELGTFFAQLQREIEG